MGETEPSHPSLFNIFRLGSRPFVLKRRVHDSAGGSAGSVRAGLLAASPARPGHPPTPFERAKAAPEGLPEVNTAVQAGGGSIGNNYDNGERTLSSLHLESSDSSSLKNPKQGHTSIQQVRNLDFGNHSNLHDPSQTSLGRFGILT